MNESENLELSPKDARTCLENARRMMRDSNRVSPESQLVLRELALEELAKGYMIFFRLHSKDPSRAKSRLRLPQVPGSEKTKVLLEGYRDLFSDATLRRAFRDHEVKVDFVEALSRVFLEAPPTLLDDRNIDTQGLPFRIVYRLAKGRVKRLSQLGDESNRRTISKILNATQRLKNPRLDSLAKRATYVDLVPEGRGCVPPEADKDLSSALGRFDRTWAAALDLALQILA